MLFRQLSWWVWYSIGKKSVDAGNSALPKEIESNNGIPKFSASDRVRVIKYENNFSKGYTENLLPRNYAMKKELKDARVVDTSNLATKKTLLLWKPKLAN